VQVRLTAQDGYELCGSFHAAASMQPHRKVVVIHSGAGISSMRYGHLAAFLAQSGIPALTYDYRGIGLSRPAALRGFRAAMEDWAEYDCAAAISWLRSRFPRAEMLGMAHSAGAWLVGGAHNAAEQARLVLIGGHTGYYGDYAERYRLPMTVMWHALMPAITRLVGYFPGRRLGLGEDIPERIALQWAGRRSPELRPTGTGPGHARTQMLLDRCAALQRPALLVAISDDAFATSAGIRRLMTHYPLLFPLQHLQFTPADAGLSRIGHFGFFSRKAGAALWPRLLAAL
jgi:predicted alpha/beta hydrolase